MLAQNVWEIDPSLLEQMSRSAMEAFRDALQEDQEIQKWALSIIAEAHLEEGTILHHEYLGIMSLADRLGEED